MGHNASEPVTEGTQYVTAVVRLGTSTGKRHGGIMSPRGAREDHSVPTSYLQGRYLPFSSSRASLKTEAQASGFSPRDLGEDPRQVLECG